VINIGYGGYATGTCWLTSGSIIATNSGSASTFSILVGVSSLSSGRLIVSNGLILARSLEAGTGGHIVLAGGTTVLSSNLTTISGSSNLVVAGGDLYVTNAGASAILSTSFSGGLIALTNGSITADSLQAYLSARFTFIGGTLTTKNTGISNGFQFVVGNGVKPATFRLNGGFHYFGNGLLINTNAALTGCGTVVGVVSNRGTLTLTCSTVFSNTVVNTATLIVGNGVTVDFYGPVINKGYFDTITGTVNFHSTFTNTGWYLDATGDADNDGFSNLQELLAGTSPTNSLSSFHVSAVGPVGNDFLISWQAGGGRTNIVQATTNFTSGYFNLSPNIILPGSGDIATNYLDAGGATNIPGRFYRIRLVP
jgi:hypothetical protein